jgi:hypothetical protein
MNVVMPRGFGVGIPHQLSADDPGYYARAVAILKPAWAYDWKWSHAGEPGYVPLKWAMRIDQAANEAMLASRKTLTPWLVGNEQQEKRKQANCTPQQAAEFSRFWADMAQGAWGGCGELLGLPETYDWLNAYLLAGGAVGAYWHVHL